MVEMRYEDSAIDKRILRGIKEMGFELMTPIQAQAIPLLLEGYDIIGQAQTGTGKTAAFGIPLIQNIDPEDKHIQAIVLCPTRELAIQAAEELRKLAKFTHGIKVLPIYGGQDINTQIRSLKTGVQIIVGTPGRVMDHMRRHTLKMNNLKTMVLDEADEMLNMGFRENIETILKGIPEEHQTALFSATMPKAIMDITDKYQKDAKLIKITRKEITVPLVKQYYYEVNGKSKADVVCRLLDYYNPKGTMIFCNTKRMVDELAEKLKGRGYFADGLHGDMSQRQRDMVMNRFRNNKTDILIATDVAARGIDVDDIEAVFNYDVPQDIEYYVHRIGRTGRAGRKGRSFTLVVGREIYKLREIEKSCKTKIKLRSIPSVNDVNEIKSQKCLNDAIDVLQNKDISKALKYVEQKINDDDITALELAAAFLRLNMGEEAKEIEKVEYKTSGKGRFSKRTYNNSDKFSSSRKNGKSNKSSTQNKSDKQKKNGSRSKSGKNDKSGRADKLLKTDKSGRADKLLKNDKSGRADKLLKNDKPGRTGKSGKTDKSGKANKSGKTDKTGKTKKSE
ncbi:MAG: DEAD/DEAH box helicase [Lachnospiraceae bacterium]|nr:DEAD/DEAH box helicase [Lachnospiraceae bacterium]